MMNPTALHKALPLLAISLLLAAGASHAQMYKSVGPDGKVTYSDQPPPNPVRQIETRPANSTAATGPALPYELAEIVKTQPVVLYVSSNCAPCDQGRSLLNARGIPFTERTVATNADIAQLREVSGDVQLPLLLVGSERQTGFSDSAWANALSSAGYPASSKLPAGYRNPAPQAAAPQTASAKPTPATPAAPAEATQPAPRLAEELPAATGNAPPGFRF